MCRPNLKFVALPVPEIIAVPKKLSVRGYAHANLSPKLLMGFCSDGPCECPKSVASPVPEIIVIGVLGWCCKPQSWGRRGSRRSGVVAFERELVTSYRRSIVTVHLSLQTLHIDASIS